MLELKQSTSITLKIGPFVDEDDGKTAETGLTITQADVRLSKNGGNIAQKNEASACTHDELGIYGCPIDTTDTNTLGRLQLWVHESGALPAWHEYMVIPANVYDSRYSTDKLQVDAVEIDSTAQRATDLAEIAQYLIANSATLTDIIADDSILAKLLATDGDISEFNENTDALQAIRDATQAVNVTSIDGTAQRATDLAEIAQYLIANSATLTDIIADDSILAKLLATDGDISGFDEATDALQAIRDAIVDASPQNHTATSSNDTTGTIASGTYTDTATNNGTYWQIAPVTPAVGGFGLNVDLVFGISVGRIPSTVFVNGYFDANPPAGSRAVEVWAYNYLSAAWEQISDSGTHMDNQSGDQDYQYILSTNHVQVADGEVKIRFTSTSTNTSDDLYLDQVLVSSVAQEASGLTPAAISEAVWNHIASGHDEDTMGYAIAHLRLLNGQIVSATNAAQFIIDAGATGNIAYPGMVIVLEDKTDNHYETRRIINYIGATKEVFVDRAFSFTPVADDDYYIMGTSYADVNTTHIEGSDATDQIPTAQEIEDEVLDALTSAHQGAGTIGKAISDGATAAGAGAITFTYTLTSSVTSDPIPDVDVWVTSDEAGTNVIASGETNSSGQVVFYLDAGTVYVWRQKPGWNFTNPDTEIVS